MTWFYGKVVSGLGLGKKLGYPTANLDLSSKHELASGVYTAQAKLGDASYRAVAIIGARQDTNGPTVEIFLLDFQGDLYNKELGFKILKKISEIERLDDREALIKKIERDFKQARECFHSS